jgi:hypothetical protein
VCGEVERWEGRFEFVKGVSMGREKHRKREMEGGEWS